MEEVIYNRFEIPGLKHGMQVKLATAKPLIENENRSCHKLKSVVGVYFIGQ